MTFYEGFFGGVGGEGGGGFDPTEIFSLLIPSRYRALLRLKGSACCVVAVFLMVVRALVGVCLGLYIMAFTMALRENCCAPTFYTCTLAGRKTEVFAFLAGTVVFLLSLFLCTFIF